jgi:hypothetical protein
MNCVVREVRVTTSNEIRECGFISLAFGRRPPFQGVVGSGKLLWLLIHSPCTTTPRSSLDPSSCFCTNFQQSKKIKFPCSPGRHYSLSSVISCFQGQAVHHPQNLNLTRRLQVSNMKPLASDLSDFKRKDSLPIGRPVGGGVPAPDRSTTVSVEVGRLNRQTFVICFSSERDFKSISTTCVHIICQLNILYASAQPELRTTVAMASRSDQLHFQSQRMT